MKEWLSDLWDAARFQTGTYAALSSRADAFLQGTIIVVIVALLAGIPAFVQELWQGGRVARTAEAAEIPTALREALEAGRPWSQQLGIPSSAWSTVIELIEQNFEMGVQIREDVDRMSTILPQPVGRILAAIGGWLSQPFTATGVPLAFVSLGTWLGYGVLVMLAAKLLGGKGTLHGFLGASALYAVPHVLDLFRWLPFIGGLLGFIAVLWGLAIYIKATQVSHELSFERGLLAVFLPLIIIVGLVILLVSILSGVTLLT